MVNMSGIFAQFAAVVAHWLSALDLRLSDMKGKRNDIRYWYC
jgi:hypothetical protein